MCSGYGLATRLAGGSLPAGTLCRRAGTPRLRLWNNAIGGRRWTVRKAGLVSVLILFGFGLIGETAFAQPAPAESPAIRIGIILSLTGRNTTVGNEMKRAMELAVADAKKKFPALSALEVVTGDDRGTAGNAARVTLQLIKDQGVKFIVGGSGSNQALGMARVCREMHVLCITPSATHTELARMGDSVIRFLPSNNAFARFLAESALDQLTFRELAVMRNSSNAFSIDLASAFVKHYQAGGGNVIAQETYDPNTYLGELIARVLKSGAKAVFIPDNTASSLPILQVWGGRPGPKPVFIGPDSWSVPSLWNTVRSLGLRVYFVSYYDPTSDAWRLFSQRMNGTPEEVSGFAGVAYDAMMLLLSSLARAETKAPLAVSRVLQKSRLEGVSGATVFSGKTTPSRDLYLLEVTSKGLKVVRKARVSD